MHRRHVLATAGIGLSGALAGCTSALGSDEGGSTSEETTTEITVSADGEVEVEPDQASLSVGIEASGESADAVRDKLATRSEPLRETFDELGLSDDAVEEGRFRIRPTREGDAFRGSRSFHLTIDDVERVGEVVDAAIDAGADDVGRVNFGLRDETRSERRNDALDEALANADDEAAHIATNREVTLTGTQAVTTDDVSVGTLRYTVDEVADDAGGPPETTFDADPVTVSASVTVVYGFEE